jgi:hypothetical protein
LPLLYSCSPLSCLLSFTSSTFFPLLFLCFHSSPSATSPFHAKRAPDPRINPSDTSKT